MDLFQAYSHIAGLFQGGLAPTLDDVRNLWDARISYFVCQTEIGETGNHHFQAYVELTRKMRLSTAVRLFKCHVTCRVSTAANASNYCKDPEKRAAITLHDSSGDRTCLFCEVGELSIPEQGRRNDLESLKTDIDDGVDYVQLWNDHWASMLRYHKAVDAYKKVQGEKRTWTTDVIVLWGESGVGKTLLAQQYLEDTYGTHGVYEQNASKWWDGYTGQPGVIVNEFSGEKGQWPFPVWKRLCDAGAVMVEPKNGAVQFLARTIIFTSNYDPREWWDGKISHGVSWTAFSRRCTTIAHVTDLGLRTFDWFQTHSIDHGRPLPWATRGEGRPWARRPGAEEPLQDDENNNNNIPLEQDVEPPHDLLRQNAHVG